MRAGSAVSRDPWRSKASLGLVLAYGAARAAFAWTDQSKSYDQQLANHRFGEVTLGVSF